MIYSFLKRVIQIALFFFYKKISVVGKENIPDKGPLIIVANHPNTMIDPLIIAAIMKQRAGFLANASLFANKTLIKFFTFFHVIPIYRQKDVKPGEKPDNLKSFSKCHEYLKDDGSIIIFPEGSSIDELKLRPIKTGTARIALGFEERNNFKGGLKIVSIALNYSNALKFRSLVSVTINESFDLSEYNIPYEKDKWKAVLMLTKRIEDELAQHVPHTSDKEEENLLIQSFKFYSQYIDPSIDRLKNPLKAFKFRKTLSLELLELHKKNPKAYTDLKEKSQEFFDLIEKEDLSMGFFEKEFQSKNKWVLLSSYILKFVVLMPFYIVGVIGNYLPYIIPSGIVKLMNTDIEYRSSILMVTAIFTFPLFYFIEIDAFLHWVDSNNYWIIILLIGLPFCGYVAMYYWRELLRFGRVLHYYLFLKPEKKKKILHLKKSIIEKIQYLNLNPEQD